MVAAVAIADNTLAHRRASLSAHGQGFRLQWCTFSITCLLQNVRPPGPKTLAFSSASAAHGSHNLLEEHGYSSAFLHTFVAPSNRAVDRDETSTNAGSEPQQVECRSVEVTHSLPEVERSVAVLVNNGAVRARLDQSLDDRGRLMSSSRSLTIPINHDTRTPRCVSGTSLSDHSSGGEDTISPSDGNRTRSMPLLIAWLNVPGGIAIGIQCRLSMFIRHIPDAGPQDQEWYFCSCWRSTLVKIAQWFPQR